MDSESKRRKQKDRKKMVFLDSKALLLCVVTIAAITINGLVFIPIISMKGKGFASYSL